jgi:hypothetical protein
MKSYLWLLVVLLMSGCSIAPTREDVGDAVDRATDLAVDYNDKKMEISELSLCASPLSAIMRNYGQDPNKIRALLTLCGWSSYNTRMIMDPQGYYQ